MGVLFPNCEQFPDHVPLASPLPSVKQSLAAIAFGLVALPFCPLIEDHHEHVPHENTAPIDYQQQTLSAIGSTSSTSDLSANLSENLRLSDDNVLAEG